jgi:hypothetical protein
MGRVVALYYATNSNLRTQNSSAKMVKYKRYFFNKEAPSISLDFTWKQQIEVFHHYNQKSQE